MRDIEDIKEELELSYNKDADDKSNSDANRIDSQNPNSVHGESTNNLGALQSDLESQKNISSHLETPSKDLKKDSKETKPVVKPKFYKDTGDSSKSETAKIARYNIQLLENIYNAYDPEQADHVVKIFRKGGLFNIDPIHEEEFEESFEQSENSQFK